MQNKNITRAQPREAQEAARGLGLPPGVDDRAAVTTDVLSVPHPRLRVDGFTHRAQHPQRGEVVLGRDGAAPLHHRADQRGCGVEDGDPIGLHDLPQPALVRGVGGAFVHHLGGSVGQPLKMI